MLLNRYGDKDRTHLRDLIDLGIVDSTWYPLLPEPLAVRLRELIEHPE